MLLLILIACSCSLLSLLESRGIGSEPILQGQLQNDGVKLLQMGKHLANESGGNAVRQLDELEVERLNLNQTFGQRIEANPNEPKAQTAVKVQVGSESIVKMESETDIRVEDQANQKWQSFKGTAATANEDEKSKSVVEVTLNPGPERKAEVKMGCKLNRETEKEAQTQAETQIRLESGAEVKVQVGSESIVKIESETDIRVEDQANQKWQSSKGPATTANQDEKSTSVVEVTLNPGPEKKAEGKVGCELNTETEREAQTKAETQIRLKSDAEVEVKEILRSEWEANKEARLQLKAVTEAVSVLETRGFPKSLSKAFRHSASCLLKPGGVVDSGMRTIQPYVEWMKTKCRDLKISHNLLMSAYYWLLNFGRARNGAPTSRSKSRHFPMADLGLKTPANGHDYKTPRGKKDGIEVSVDSKVAELPRIPPESPEKIFLESLPNRSPKTSPKTSPKSSPKPSPVQAPKSPPASLPTAPPKPELKPPPVDEDRRSGSKGMGEESPAITSAEEDIGKPKTPPQSPQTPSEKSSPPFARKSPPKEKAVSFGGEVLGGDPRSVAGAVGESRESNVQPQPPQKSPKRSPPKTTKKSPPKEKGPIDDRWSRYSGFGPNKTFGDRPVPRRPS